MCDAVLRTSTHSLKHAPQARKHQTPKSRTGIILFFCSWRVCFLVCVGVPLPPLFCRAFCCCSTVVECGLLCRHFFYGLLLWPKRVQRTGPEKNRARPVRRIEHVQHRARARLREHGEVSPGGGCDLCSMFHVLCSIRACNRFAAYMLNCCVCVSVKKRCVLPASLTGKMSVCVERMCEPLACVRIRTHVIMTQYMILALVLLARHWPRCCASRRDWKNCKTRELNTR